MEKLYKTKKEGKNMQYVYVYSFAWDSRLEHGSYGIGDEVLVYSRVDNMKGTEEFRFSKRFAANGYPGNMGSSITRFHGWRGTTDDVAVYAHGVYTIKNIEYSKGTGTVKFTLNRKDIRKGDA